MNLRKEHRSSQLHTPASSPSIHLIGAPRRSDFESGPLPLDYPLFLLTLLATAEHGMSRQAICELMYPDVEPVQARQRLRQVLYRIRQLELASQMHADRERLQWLEGSDLHQLKQAIRHNDVAAIHHLYQQDLLEGFSDFDTPFGAWLSFERSALLHTWIDATLRHAQNLLEEKAFEACTTLLVTLLNRDPLQETALLTLFKCTEHTQQYHFASLHYEKYIQHLKSELGLQPPMAIERAYQQLSNHQQMQPITLCVGRSVLVGRQQELQHVGTLLQQPEVRLISIFGPGGIGKTSLVLELKRQTHLPVTVMDCVPFSRMHTLGEQLAAALNLPLNDPTQTIRTLQDHFRQFPQVLILDNVEHLLPELTRLLQDLLQVPTLKLLVTTRTKLQMPQEHVLELHGLEYHLNSPHRSQAAELFIRVLLRQHPNCRLDASEERTIEQICERLQGLPLAIELAAAWCRLLTVKDLKAQLDLDLNLLDGSLGGLPERHQSLRTVFEHSWKLLGTDAQHTLKMLSVFPGSFTPQAALHLTGKGYQQLLQLLDQSLLKRNASEKQRLEMHPVIREYAFAFLQEDPDALDLAHQNLLRHAESTAQQNPLRNTTNPFAAMQVFTLEYSNLMAALTWATINGHLERAIQLAIQVNTFWQSRCLFQQGLQCMQNILKTASSSLDPSLLIDALNVTGTMHWFCRNYQESEQAYLRSLQLSQQHQLVRQEHRAHSNMGMVRHKLGDTAQSRHHLTEALRCAERLGKRSSAVSNLLNLAVLNMLEHCFEDARTYAEEGLQYAREQGDHSMTASILGLLGLLDLIEDRQEAAEHHLSECLSILEPLNHWQKLSNYLHYAGVMRFRQQHPEAFHRFLRHLTIGMEGRDHELVRSSIEHLCVLLYHNGKKELASRWWNSVQALKQQAPQGNTRLGVWVFEVPWPEQVPPKRTDGWSPTLEALVQEMVEQLSEERLF